MQGLTDAIAQQSVLLDLDASSAREIFEALMDLAVARKHLPADRRAALVETLLAREEESPTALGNSVAVPHVYAEGVVAPAIVFARLHKPVELGAPDHIPTQYVFLLLGPSKRSAEHLDTLAAIARLMSDEDFRYEAGEADSIEDLAEAIGRFEARTKAPRPEVHTAVDDGLVFTGKFAGGIRGDFRRRMRNYRADFTDGLSVKTLSATGFLFFACLAPAVTFGGVMADQTGGHMGAVEMLLASAICGVVYALFSGSPLIILGATGPMLIITVILYGLCEELGLPFFPVYAWVGLWSALILVLLALFDASALMRYFTRFTDEIFATLISLIFIVEALKATLGFVADPDGDHGTAFLSVLLSFGCFYLAMTFFQFRRSRYLQSWIREFLADFGPTIALAAMTLLGLYFSDVVLASLNAPDTFAPTMERAWLVNPLVVPVWVWFASIVPALFVAILVFLDQNITARVVNAPDHKLVKGTAYHLDLGLVGVLMAVCSVLGLPWVVAATVRSVNHVRALATVESQQLRDGSTRERIIHTRENRLTGLAIHVLIGLGLLALPLIKLVPMAVLYGLFLYMGVVSLRGNQFFDRLLLWPTEKGLYPQTHYLRRVPPKIVHAFTAVQAGCLLILWVVKASVLAILFPLFIAALVPVRFFLSRHIGADHLDALDSDETPDED